MTETVTTNNLLGATIKTSILSVFGAQDSEFIVALATAFQKNIEFALNKDATVDTLPNTPQALTLGRTAPLFDSTMATWLCQRSFGAFSGRCTAGAGTAPGASGGRAVAAPLSAAGGAFGSSSTGGGADPGSGRQLAVTGTSTTRELLAAGTIILLGATISLPGRGAQAGSEAVAWTGRA